MFDLVIPVSKTVSKMKQTVQQMQKKKGFQEHTTQNPTQQETPKKPVTTNTNDEYIEFEEVK